MGKQDGNKLKRCIACGSNNLTEKPNRDLLIYVCECGAVCHSFTWVSPMTDTKEIGLTIDKSEGTDY